MKFQLNCERMDGFVLLDTSFLKEFDDSMLYAMDILLDVQGTSELIFDFPDEEWSSVRPRETEIIKNFCNSGKMVLWLIDEINVECEFNNTDVLSAPSKWLHLPTGKLLAVTANELIQCLAYPELEMEIIFELDLPKGWYALSNEGMDKILYCQKTPEHNVFENIEEY